MMLIRDARRWIGIYIGVTSEIKRKGTRTVINIIITCLGGSDCLRKQL